MLKFKTNYNPNCGDEKMIKAPAPSKLTIKLLDKLMVADTIKGMRCYKEGRIDMADEALEVIRNRRIQKETNYQEYRDWYKGLTPQGRSLVIEES